jgi:hypothetical protein
MEREGTVLLQKDKPRLMFSETPFKLRYYFPAKIVKVVQSQTNPRGLPGETGAVLSRQPLADS